MMNPVTKTVGVLALLASTSTAVMAESIDVKVIGTITPTACKPTLAGGGTIDYGVIPPASLKKDTVTVLDEKQVDFSITCDAAAKVAVHAVGSKIDTITDGSKGFGVYPVFSGGALFGVKSVNVDGLGKTDEGKNIGGYGIRLVPQSYTVDGKKADTIMRRQKSDNWTSSPAHDAGSLYTASTRDLHISWAKPGEKTPTAFTSLAGKLGVQAYITKTSELNLTKPVKLDGLTTLELVYL